MKYLPVDDGVESLQWVARFAQAGVAVLKVKEAFLHAAPLCFSGSLHNVSRRLNDDKN